MELMEFVGIDADSGLTQGFCLSLEVLYNWSLCVLSFVQD